jgi:ubiquitin carboxyl-terminal hydrolase L3
MDMSMRLIELDGRRTGPIDRGECDNLLWVRKLSLHSTSFVVQRCRSFIQDVARIVKEKFIAQSTSVKFSMVALVSS